MAALLGSSAPGLSASTITRLKEVWGVEAERWQRRDLTAKRYVYFWVDGIYFSARMEEEKQCILVIVGATDKGQKELIAIASSSLRPSSSAPMITHMHCLSWSSRGEK